MELLRPITAAMPASRRRLTACAVETDTPGPSAPSPTAPVLDYTPESTLVCTSITATSLEGAVEEIKEAATVGADLVELRIDFMKDFDYTDPDACFQRLFLACHESQLVPIVTIRPKWEGGQYEGQEAPRLACLKFAALMGAPFIDVEHMAAKFLFASDGQVPVTTRIILSHHNYEDTPSLKVLQELRDDMFNDGADIVKIATMAKDVSDSMRVLLAIDGSPGPVIALAMGEKGLPSRLLAPRYGGFLTFGALGKGRESAPGQPTLEELHNMYRVHLLTMDMQVMGIVGNPVSHSRSPAIHNAALAEHDLNAMYVPMLVDDLRYFLAAFGTPDYRGWSVTIPHKVAAWEAADELDPLAAKIGAVNTLVRQQDGGLKGYNTDCAAAITAIEAGLRESGRGGPGGAGEPLRGLRVVVIGAGGAGRAVAFGAAERGARVIICNRTLLKAADLAAAVGEGVEAVPLQDVESGETSGDVLVNTTSVGMHGDEGSTPVPRAALSKYRLVFDAVYTPLETRLLKEAKEEGCAVVSGVEMFIGQAVEQYRLFTKMEPPVDLMRKVVMDSLS